MSEPQKGSRSEGCFASGSLRLNAFYPSQSLVQEPISPASGRKLALRPHSRSGLCSGPREGASRHGFEGIEKLPTLVLARIQEPWFLPTLVKTYMCRAEAYLPRARDVDRQQTASTWPCCYVFWCSRQMGCPSFRWLRAPTGVHAMCLSVQE